MTAVSQRSTYEAVVARRDGAFGVERPPYLSPAAAAQDRSASGSLGQFAQMLLPLEYTGWAEESAAHVRTCYLGDWSPLNKVRITGPQALEFLGQLGMNDLSAFATGQLKHHVQLDEHGWVASEGVLWRVGEQEFLYTAGSGDWLRWQLGTGSWDAEATDVSPDTFIFGVQGPNSLAVLERATGEGLHDIAFNRSRGSRIGDSPVRLLRTGISGELGYEVHGPAVDGSAVWSLILDAGGELGIRELGFRSQAVQHIEAGIATNGLDYLPASILTPGAPTQFRQRPVHGSFVPTAGITDYFRKPCELGWGGRRVGNHDFLGRDALAADAAAGGPARRLVGLEWHHDDVAAVLAAAAGPGDPVDPMELPRFNGLAFDRVERNGASVGVSSGRTLSTHLRATISLCVLEREHATPDTDVIVVWGRPGTVQREVRARVRPLPFKPDRRRTDVTAL